MKPPQGESATTSSHRLEGLAASFEVPLHFDPKISTEDLYRSDVGVSETEDTDDLVSRVRREKLDYGFHKRYIQSRRLFQDKLIHALLDGPPICESTGNSGPWLILTGGEMGAGKSHVVRWLIEQGLLPLSSLMGVDPDRIKRCLPEWRLYVTGGSGCAGSMTHKESVLISEVAEEVALRQGRNVWVDGSLRDTEWYIRSVTDIRKRFPNFRIAVLYVTAPRETILSRVQSRAKETGRLVLVDKVDASIQGSSETVRKLQGLVDITAVVDNAGLEPRLVSIETAGIFRFARQWSDFKRCFTHAEAVEPWLAIARLTRSMDEFVFGHSAEPKDESVAFDQRAKDFGDLVDGRLNQLTNHINTLRSQLCKF